MRSEAPKKLSLENRNNTDQRFQVHPHFLRDIYLAGVWNRQSTDDDRSEQLSAVAGGKTFNAKNDSSSSGGGSHGEERRWWRAVCAAATLMLRLASLPWSNANGLAGNSHQNLLKSSAEAAVDIDGGFTNAAVKDSSRNSSSNLVDSGANSSVLSSMDGTNGIHSSSSVICWKFYLLVLTQYCFLSKRIGRKVQSEGSLVKNISDEGSDLWDQSVAGASIVTMNKMLGIAAHSVPGSSGDWCYSPVSNARSPVTGYVGIRNLGNICYMNAIMQQFFMLPALRIGSPRK